MVPHSSILAWKIPWTEEPGRLQSMRSLRVGHDWVTSLSLFTFLHWKRKRNSLQCSCLENPRDGEAWWAAVYGVAQSRIWLKRLSSSSSSMKLICDTVVIEAQAIWCWNPHSLQLLRTIWGKRRQFRQKERQFWGRKIQMRNNDQSNFPVGWCLLLLVLPLDLAGVYIKQRFSNLSGHQSHPEDLLNTSAPSPITP